jgi:hypothetical protein
MWTRLFSKKMKERYQECQVVTDLDAILTRTVGFRFGGRVHKIPPMDVTQFMEAMNALATIDLLRQKKVVEAEELLAAYVSLFTIVCPTIRAEDIQSMNHHQIGALLNTIMELIMGKPELEHQKKSSLGPMGENTESLPGPQAS